MSFICLFYSFSAFVCSSLTSYSLTWIIQEGSCFPNCTLSDKTVVVAWSSTAPSGPFHCQPLLNFLQEQAISCCFKDSRNSRSIDRMAKEGATELSGHCMCPKLWANNTEKRKMESTQLMGNKQARLPDSEHCWKSSSNLTVETRKISI